MSDSFERAWTVLKMPNMYGDDPMDGNTIDGPLGQGSHADSMRQMNPRLLDALINMRVEDDKRMPTPPMHQNPMDKLPPSEPYMGENPKENRFKRPSPNPDPRDMERQKRIMENPRDNSPNPKGDMDEPYGGGEPYGGQGEGPMREMSPKNYEKKRSEEKRRTAGGDRKGKSPDQESPAKKPKLGQGLIDRARKNTHTMPGSTKYEKPSDKKEE